MTKAPRQKRQDRPLKTAAAARRRRADAPTVPAATDTELGTTEPAVAKPPTPADASRRVEDTSSDIKIGNRKFASTRGPSLGAHSTFCPTCRTSGTGSTRRISGRFGRPSIPRIAFSVRDQGKSIELHRLCPGPCDRLLMFREVRQTTRERVSARMLYEMAKRNDEWVGSAYEGSSIRGADQRVFPQRRVRGDRADDVEKASGSLTYRDAKEARSNRLGAYYPPAARPVRLSRRAERNRCDLRLGADSCELGEAGKGRHDRPRRQRKRAATPSRSSATTPRVLDPQFVGSRLGTNGIAHWH